MGCSNFNVMPRTKEFDPNITLTKALEVFWTKGYDGTSMQDLVDHLGISRASMYSTYGDKRSLFLAAFKLYRERGLAFIREYFSTQGSVKAGLKGLFVRTMEDSLKGGRKGCFNVNTTCSIQPGDEVILRAVKDHRQLLEKEFAQFLQQGVDSGEIVSSGDIKVLASMLVTYYHGLTVITKIQHGRKKEMAAIDALLSAL